MGCLPCLWKQIEMLFKSPSTILTVTDEVIQVWLSHQQNHYRKKEACGILIGSSNEEETELKLSLATPPMKKDFRSRHNFKILDPHHQHMVDKEWADSDGFRFFLGFWHTHPQAIPAPSGLDRTEWKNNYKLNKKQMKSLFYPIIGTKEIAIWKVSKNNIIKMEVCKNENI